MEDVEKLDDGLNSPWKIISQIFKAAKCMELIG